jgi:hypothetical protein
MEDLRGIYLLIEAVAGVTVLGVGLLLAGVKSLTVTFLALVIVFVTLILADPKGL